LLPAAALEGFAIGAVGGGGGGSVDCCIPEALPAEVVEDDDDCSISISASTLSISLFAAKNTYAGRYACR